MKYKVVFIDWDKTLSTSRFWDIWKDTEHDSKYAEVQKLFSDKELIDGWMVGKTNAEQISKKLSEIIAIEQDFALNSLIASAQLMTVSDATLQKIQDLRSHGTKVVIATDNMDTFTRWTVPALGLDKKFDAILNSYDLKVRKADTDEDGKSKFFQKFIEKNRLKAGESVLLDDNERHVIVKNFGIDFLQVTDCNPNEHLENILNENKY